MDHFRVQFFSTSRFGGVFDIGYTVEQCEIVIDFLYIFPAEFNATSQTVSLDYKYQNSKELQTRLEKFTLKYKDALPEIQQLSEKFKNLSDNEWFFVLPPVELTTKCRYELEKELNHFNGYKNLVDDEQVQALFGDIIDNYKLVTFDLDRKSKIKIGEPDKKKRVCRFCQRKVPKVAFRKEAHAISEALGNKKLILNEECDSCNEFFDKNIERHFIYYHDLARTIFGVKNKENVTPKMKGRNFQLSRDDLKNLSVAILENEASSGESGIPQKITLKTENKINLQNIYKSLCKFALSAVDSKYIHNFVDTIKWISGKKEADVLPKIAVLNSHSFFSSRPELVLYLRNNENYKIPYLVGEFRITFHLYVFIVPFSNKDKNDFVDELGYAEFLSCFKNIQAKNDFSFVDFSQNIERELNFVINFEQSV